MRRINFGTALVIYIFLMGVLHVFGVDNPRFKMADGCVERFNGDYYAMGTGTMGRMFHSSDLFNWDDSVLVFEPKAKWPMELEGKPAEEYYRAGAGDLVYRNGIFHIYFNGIGHGYSANPLGPYIEHSLNEPFDPSGIDAQLFQDDDGALVYVKKKNGIDPDPITGKTRTHRGGQIWAWDFETPWQKTGTPRKLLDGQKGSWDSVDNLNFEGPELYKYRNKYYLLYVANCMSSRTGLYDTGVAVADSAVGFSNHDKVPGPVLKRNTERLFRSYKTILPTAEKTGWQGCYTTSKPPKDWNKPGFNDKAWTTGTGGFGSPDEDRNTQIRACRSEWNSDDIWVRRSFTLEEKPKRLALKVRHETAAEVYVNGIKVYEYGRHIRAYRMVDISTQVEPVLRVGDNSIAVHVRYQSPKGPPRDGDWQWHQSYHFVDFGLYDTGGVPVEDVVYGPSQPNMITGPNGFEQWITYKAFWNGEETGGQGIDRVFFFDREMFVDGPTTTNTPGYHPPPALPTWRGGVATLAAGGRSMVPSDPATHYLFEASLKLPAGGNPVAGVVAFKGGEGELLITLDSVKRMWSYRLESNGKTETKEFPLPKQFFFRDPNPLAKALPSQFHLLRVTKNAGAFAVMLDAFSLTGKELIQTGLVGEGLPGLYAETGPVEFGSAIYTIGWDEFDRNIAGWETVTGDWNGTDRGLEQNAVSGRAVALKGDPLDQYEFLVNADCGSVPTGGESLGVLPLYVDNDNYLSARIDAQKGSLVVSGKKNGQPAGPWIAPLRRQVERCHTFDKSDNETAWVYDLRSESVVGALEVRWFEGRFEHLGKTFVRPQNIRIEVLANGRWTPVRFSAKELSNGFQRLEFDPVAAVAVRVGMDAGKDKASRPEELFVDVGLESRYFFRCVKRSDRLVLFLNGHEMLTVDGAWPAARVGLTTQDLPVVFNGITLYHRK